MRITIASGKGGTGKTTLATSLAAHLAEQGLEVAYLDCDVEAPNGHLFLKPEWSAHRCVDHSVPRVDLERCTFCGDCSAACRFSAILPLADRVLTFPELCHACGGCRLACPSQAITEQAYPLGEVRMGRALDSKLAVVQGELRIGRPSAVPVIRAVIEAGPAEGLQIVDGPPGSACPMVETVRRADAVLLVTEPTPFGLADLQQAAAVVAEVGRPMAVAVNRADCGDREVWRWCRDQGIEVVLELPDDRRVAEATARGQLAVQAVAELQPRLDALAERLFALARSARSSRPRGPAPPLGPQGGVPPSELLVAAGDPRPREISIVSGKGGTGKTSLCAALRILAEGAVVADCDVDAADLHLVLAPRPLWSWSLRAGHRAEVDAQRCSGCGECVELCRFAAIGLEGGLAQIDSLTCEGCGVCADHCPEQAIALSQPVCGSWTISEARGGPLVHAQLGAGRESSGKLVSRVRLEARALARQQGRGLVLIDGSPGVGCPVIASLTTADLALVVCEPSPAGLHDAERVLELARRLEVPAAACINKVDLCPELSHAIERRMGELGVPVLGRIRYDASVTRAQVHRRTVLDEPDGPAAADIRALWKELRHVVER